MPPAYQRLRDLVPSFLQRRINPLEASIHDLVAAAAAGAAGGRVLDAGAGESRFRELFAASTYVALDRAVGDADWDYGGLDVIADLKGLPAGDSSFDLVINIQVLEHVRRPRAVIEELARVLRPGGQLVLTAPQGWGEHQQPHDYYRFTRWALQSLAESAGLEGVRISPMGGYFHYLGHRMTYIPKVLFSRRNGPVRILLLPLEIACLALFCGLGPLCCYYLDRFDPEPEFTLGYALRAVKPGR